MAVTPVVDEGLGHSAYVVDLGDGGSLVVEPERDPRPCATTLAAAGPRPRSVIETHLHADLVSGGLELVAQGAELLAYLLKDGSRPLGLFSGGTLMAGGIARTDLLSPELTEPLARQAHRPIRDRLLANEVDEGTFVARSLSGCGTYPAYFLELRDVNRAGFAAGHIPGALANAWRPAFVTWLGWLVDRDRDVVLVVDDSVPVADLARAAATVGYDRLDGGPQDLAAAGVRLEVGA